MHSRCGLGCPRVGPHHIAFYADADFRHGPKDVVGRHGKAILGQLDHAVDALGDLESSRALTNLDQNLLTPTTIDQTLNVEGHGGAGRLGVHHEAKASNRVGELGIDTASSAACSHCPSLDGVPLPSHYEPGTGQLLTREGEHRKHCTVGHVSGAR